MENFYYMLVLIGGSMLAYYIVFVVGKKFSPSSIAGKSLPPAIGFVLQVLIPAALIPMVSSAFFKNLDKTFEVTKNVGDSGYLSFIGKIFESAESIDRLWSIVTLAIVLTVFRYIIENMPDRPSGLTGAGIALAIVILAATTSSVLWDLVADKIWLKVVQMFDNIWWETTPGEIIRKWLFPDIIRLP